MTETNAPAHKRLLYGRTQGHKLRDGQRRLVDHLLPEIELLPNNPLLTEPVRLFEHQPEQIFIEIGFGGGEHLVHRALNNPQYGYIGVEPFINGMAKLLSQIEEHSIRNIRPYMGDARDLIENLSDASVDGAILLYPDPWPKKRHNKRRFVNQENLNHLHRILKPGAEFFFASDIPQYVRWTLSHVNKHGGFEWTAASPEDWRNPPTGWPGTRYEAKAYREGRKGHYLHFRKL